MNLVPLSASHGSQREHPPFSLEEWQMKSISLALNEAWNRISTKNPGILNQKEPITTIDICDTLAQIQSDEIIAGFTQETFETPDPNTQRRSAPGSALESRSNDFILRPSGYFPGGNKRKYGLVVESKRLKNKTHGLDEYVTEGMHRFIVDGDYAEYMTHAMMLAYSDGTYELPSSLQDYLDYSQANKVKICRPNTTGRVLNYKSSCCVYVTSHDRNFKIDGLFDATPIEIHHLWLVVHSKSA